MFVPCGWVGVCTFEVAHLGKGGGHVREADLCMNDAADLSSRRTSVRYMNVGIFVSFKEWHDHEFPVRSTAAHTASVELRLW